MSNVSQDLEAATYPFTGSNGKTGVLVLDRIR